jgi:hypothetical protein
MAKASGYLLSRHLVKRYRRFPRAAIKEMVLLPNLQHLILLPDFFEVED